MKIDVELDLLEAYNILEAALSSDGVEIGQIAVCSWNKPRLIFHRDGLVEGAEFRHRLVYPKEPAP